MAIKFNILELNKAKYDNFERNDQGLVLSCTLTDSDNNTVYVKNIEWVTEEPRSFYIQDKYAQPSEMWLLNKTSNENFIVTEKVNELEYGKNGLAVAFWKTLANKEKFYIHDIKYDEAQRIIYCKQRAENGTVREFFDFIFDNNGKYISCSQMILGTNDRDAVSRTLIKQVKVRSSLNEIVNKIFRNNLDNLEEERKTAFLKKLTSLLQILGSIKSDEVNDAFSNKQLNTTDILDRTRYKLDTPLLQVFSSIGDTNADINGEQTLNKILEVIESRILGRLESLQSSVLEKITNNMSSLILQQVFAGNYSLTEFGSNLVELGFKLKAESEPEAISFAIRHIYYNVNNLLNEKEVQRFHFRNLDNFILVRL